MVELPMHALQHLLVCPVSKNRLDFSTGLIRCSLCGLQFLQARNDCFDLLLPHHISKKKATMGKASGGDRRRYKDLIANLTAEATDWQAQKRLNSRIRKLSKRLGHLRGRLLGR